MSQGSAWDKCPDDLFADRVGYVVRRFQQALRAELGHALRRAGLTVSQYACLLALQRLPGMSNADLARLLSVTPQTMLKIVKGLDEAGLITRTPSRTHGRLLHTTLTPAGVDIVERAHPLVRDAEDRLLAPLSSEDRSQLLRWLLACCASVDVDVDLPDLAVGGSACGEGVANWRSPLVGHC